MTDLSAQVAGLGSEAKRDFLIGAIETLTVEEVLGLVKTLEDKWGIESTPSVGAGIQAPPEEAEEQEQTEFDVFVTEIGEKKIAVVRAYRQLAELDLKSASAGLKQALPVKVGEKLSKDKADDWKRQLEEAGASVEVK